MLYADNNFTSFQRQLNLYGFKRLRFNAHSNGPETSALLTGVVINGVGGGAGTPGSSAGGSSSTSHSSYKGTYIYSHPLFIFNRRDLCDNIRRVPVTPNGKSKQVQQQQLATVLAFATEGGISGANSEEAGVITDGISITNKSNSISSSSSSKAKDLSNNNTSNNNRNGGSNGNSATMNMINAMNGRRQGETMSMGGQGLSSEGLQLGLGVDNEEGADELYSVLLSMKDFVPSNRVADSSILGSDTTDTTVVSTAMPQQQQQQQQQ